MTNDTVNPLLILLDLNRRARRAADLDELAFLAVNDSRAVATYRQAVLWFAKSGVKTLSGVVQPEANAPYVHWLNRVCRSFCQQASTEFMLVSARELPEPEAAEWQEWLPEHGLWIPLNGGAAQESNPGGLLFAAETSWTDTQIALLREWVDAWQHAWQAKVHSQSWPWWHLGRSVVASSATKPWWWRPRILLLVAAAIVLLIPVRLSVLAPGELVPANPATIRAPLDGVIGQFHVLPNQKVHAGQALFGFDEASLAARRDVATQGLATAETEYRQFATQTDSKSKAQLSQLLGRIEEKKTEASFLDEQLERTRVVSPVDGIALFDDPTEWIGKPVQAGERVMRIATPGDVEVEAWLAIADAIPLAEGAKITLYLAADPLTSIPARLRYMSHDAVARPNGTYAYRVRARLEAGTELRVGLKGTAKLYGSRVPIAYWILRRPLATVRQYLGI